MTIFMMAHVKCAGQLAINRRSTCENRLRFFSFMLQLWTKTLQQFQEKDTTISMEWIQFCWNDWHAMFTACWWRCVILFTPRGGLPGILPAQVDCPIEKKEIQFWSNDWHAMYYIYKVAIFFPYCGILGYKYIARPVHQAHPKMRSQVRLQRQKWRERV